MKVAISYENGEVFQQFGRTPQFKIYEVEDEKIKSSQVIDTGGTGHGALAGFLRERGVEVMICGGIGGGAIMAMAESGDATCDHHEHEEHNEHGCGHGGCHH